jgi:hypothetical protein
MLYTRETTIDYNKVDSETKSYAIRDTSKGEQRVQAGFIFNAETTQSSESSGNRDDGLGSLGDMASVPK